MIIYPYTFNNYMPHPESRETQYNLGPISSPFHTYHMLKYAESCLVYIFVVTENKLALVYHVLVDTQKVSIWSIVPIDHTRVMFYA